MPSSEFRLKAFFLKQFPAIRSNLSFRKRFFLPIKGASCGRSFPARKNHFLNLEDFRCYRG